MIVLAFDTSMGAVSVAVARDRGGAMLVDGLYEERQTGHAERLFPMIEEVLRRSSLRADSIGRVAVTAGPGTFTGVRTTVAAARGLALAAGYEVVAITSLETMALGVRRRLGRGDLPLAVAVDARRSQVYVQLFDAADDPAASVSVPQLLDIDDAARLLPGAAIASGSGAGLLAEAAARHGKSVRVALGTLEPDAADVARVAMQLPVRRVLTPLYIRPPDAKPPVNRDLRAREVPAMDTSAMPFDPARVSLLWARPEQAAGLAHLHAGLFEEPWTAASFETMLNHPGSVALVACTASPMDMGGFALAQLAADEAEILSVGVRQDWQKRGIATKLVEGLKRASRNAGARSLYLEVAESNLAAIRLYGKTGFAEAGRRKGYYARQNGSREDALLLKASL